MQIFFWIGFLYINKIYIFIAVAAVVGGVNCVESGKMNDPDTFSGC